jgi:hypothetical protein
MFRSIACRCELLRDSCRPDKWWRITNILFFRRASRRYISGVVRSTIPWKVGPQGLDYVALFVVLQPRRRPPIEAHPQHQSVTLQHFLDLGK